MNQQPDKFFREKLEGFSKPVPASAWNKVTTQLDKKKTSVIWLRIAAGLLMICVASFLLWNSEPEVDQKFVASKKEQPAPNSSKEKAVVPNDTAKVVLQDSHQTDVVQKPDVKKKKIAPLHAKPEKRNEVEQVASQTNSLAANTNEASAKQKSEDVTPETIASVEKGVLTNSIVPASEEATITILYQAEEIDNKYLDKSSLEEATSEDKKQSTLRKLLDKAYDLKHNQDPIGSLRQKKNEILALNFKNDKQRSQNR